MLVLGMAALMMGVGTVPLRLDMPATSRQTLYRIGRKPQARLVYRATPILNSLVVASRSRDHGRHSELQVANLSFAVEGRRRLGAGIDRMSLATTRLSSGRTGAQVKVATVDYIADAGWSIGGGWRATSATNQRYSADRLAAMAFGAPTVASAGFVEGTMPVADRATLRIEGSSARLGENDGRLLGGTTDRRITLSLRRTL